MLISLNAVKEEKPGEQWRGLFEKYWPYYKKWFLSEGYVARPGYLTSRDMLEYHMPELAPIYDQLVELAGGTDLKARFLSLYSPPPYLSGCSQMAWTRDKLALVRNYDYSLLLYEGAFLYTNWLRPVMAMSDCIWGALDGMNDAGLCVSLSFGGRKVYGQGFGIPLLLRYVLETCNTAQEACNTLLRLPVHMPYNVTVLDTHGVYFTLYLAPDRPHEVAHTPIGTNHQHHVEWEDYARLSATVERRQYLEYCLWDPQENLQSIISKFLRPPLYNTNFLQGFGTLYTAAYYPLEKRVELIWPTKTLSLSFADFPASRNIINLKQDYKHKLTL